MKTLDITSEEYRTYHYPNYTYSISSPQYVILSDSGSHRVLDGDGISHWISPGFLQLVGKLETGKRNSPIEGFTKCMTIVYTLASIL